MIIIPVQAGPLYIQKKDIDTIAEQTGKTLKINYLMLLGFYIFVTIGISLFVLFEIFGRFVENGVEPPYWVMLLPALNLLGGVWLLYNDLTQDILDRAEVEKIKQAPEDPVLMVNKTLVNKKLRNAQFWYAGSTMIAILAPLFISFAILAPILD